MRSSLSVLGSVLGLALTASAANADTMPAKTPQCFFINNFENWKAADAKTLYIRVNRRQYYRLDLSASCPAVLWPNAYLITKWRGSSSVCTALDWDIKVAQNPGGGASGCIVKTMTPLSAEEAAAIPAKAKP